MTDDLPENPPEAAAPAPAATGPTPAPSAPDPSATAPHRRSLLALGGRASLALIAVASAVVLAAGVLLIPSPSVVAPVTSVAVTPDRSDQVLVCAGAALGLTRGDDPSVAAVAGARLRSAGEGLVESNITTSDALDGSVAVVTLPQDAPGVAVAATQAVQASTSDVSGLAMAECLPAARSAWLVGGATTVGRTTWIVLTNADDVDATVDLRVFGDAGPIDAPGTSGLIVAAGSQRIVSLAGIVVGQASPVVHVTSTGGSVAATLQTSIVRGLTPGGVSIVTPIAEPAVRHVIAALPVIASQAVLEQSTADGGVDGLTALRLLAPGDDDGEVRVTLVPREGGVSLSTEALLKSGTVLDLPFTELTDGEYSVIVEADVPIVVAGRTSSAGADGIDVEWFTPSPELEAGADVLVSVAPLEARQSALLHLIAADPAAVVTVGTAADTAAAAAVVTVDGVDIEVPAGTSVVVPSLANTGVRISTTAAVHASFSYRGDGLLAGSRVLGPPSASRPLTVLVD